MQDGMKYFAIDNLGAIQVLEPEVTFSQATLHPIPPKGGLYMPEKIPGIYLENVEGRSHREMLYEVLRPYISRDEIQDWELRNVLRKLDFQPSIKRIADNIYCVDLTGMPTESFKDEGMYVNTRIIDLFSRLKGVTSTLLGETSGDTGAAAQYFANGLRNVQSVMLFPDGRVSDYQRAQICRAGKNLIPVCVEGADFNQCKELTTRAFMDPDLADLNLVAPNSKSIARLIPQMEWYVALWEDVCAKTDFDNIEVYVPSGNFGDATGGVWALNAIRRGNSVSTRIGTPEIKKVHMVTNANDVVPRLYKTQVYSPSDVAVHTISNAMDVSKPSNLPRILDTYGLDLTPIDGTGVFGIRDFGLGWYNLNQDTSAQSISDDVTKDTMRKWYSERGVIMCPHTAVAASGLDKVSKLDEQTAYAYVATAKPDKFAPLINGILGKEVVRHPQINWAVQNPRVIENDYGELKEILLELM